MRDQHGGYKQRTSAQCGYWRFLVHQPVRSDGFWNVNICLWREHRVACSCQVGSHSQVVTRQRLVAVVDLRLRPDLIRHTDAWGRLHFLHYICDISNQQIWCIWWNVRFINNNNESRGRLWVCYCSLHPIAWLPLLWYCCMDLDRR